MLCYLTNHLPLSLIFDNIFFFNFQIFVSESLHTIGLALLMFKVLPEIDVVKGAMITNCLCIIPAILGLLSRNSRDSKRFMKVIVDMAAIGAQVTGFILWPLLENKPVLWLIPISSICISLGWWENYVTRQSPIGKLSFYELSKAKSRMRVTCNSRS